jgi:DNA-binding IclR family transcriptional regulator
MLAALPPAPGERDEVALARRRGFAVSYGEIASSVIGISAVVPGARTQTSIGLSMFEAPDEDALGRLVVDAATRLGALLR